jgi:hypothetical protein
VVGGNQIGKKDEVVVPENGFNEVCLGQSKDAGKRHQTIEKGRNPCSWYALRHKVEEKIGGQIGSEVILGDDKRDKVEKGEDSGDIPVGPVEHRAFGIADKERKTKGAKGYQARHPSQNLIELGGVVAVDKLAQEERRGKNQINKREKDVRKKSHNSPLFKGKSFNEIKR